MQCRVTVAELCPVDGELGAKVFSATVSFYMPSALNVSTLVPWAAVLKAWLYTIIL